MLANTYQVNTGYRVTTVVDDLTTQFRVLLSGRVVSAAFGQQPLPQFTVTADRPGFFIKTMPDGFFCLAGNEAQLFPVYPVNFNLTITAPYQRAVTLPVAITAVSDLPLTLPDTALLYQPVRLQGRVTLDDVARTPVAGATVAIDDTAVLTLRTPLHFDHPAGTPVQPLTLSGSGTIKTLTAPAAQFSNTLALNNRTGLAPGSVLRLGTAVSTEYALIDAISGNPPNPGDVRLTAGLQRSLPVGAAVELASAGPPGAAVSLLDDVLAGEGILRLAGSLTAVAIQIADANPARLEYHTLHALTDAAGYYRLDGLSRVTAVTLHATDGTDTDDQDWTLNYRQPVNVIDFRLD
ncbi:MAG: hypothetical protein KC441_12375 [Anaerolineales bacterium]|nr:hypothetical protein [Anaerolineales bacterium]